MVHCHPVHLPLGALLSPCTMCRTGNTINGTIYAGIRARTTGAPQQHWFGPSGDPRSAGIHTPEAIKLCWSSHREIIYDYGPVAKDWVAKQS